MVREGEDGFVVAPEEKVLPDDVVPAGVVEPVSPEAPVVWAMAAWMNPRV